MQLYIVRKILVTLNNIKLVIGKDEFYAEYWSSSIVILILKKEIVANGGHFLWKIYC